MTTRKHVHEEVFDTEPKTLFALLHTPSAIRRWWGASHVIVDSRPGGVWIGLWGDEDSPEFITAGRMSVFDPPKRIVFSDFEYFARSGPLPFAANLTSEFNVSPIGPGKTLLRVVQDGFPMDTAADDFYAGCEKGWRDTFAGIRSYLAESEPPAVAGG